MAGVMKYTMSVRNPETLEATPLLAGEPVPDWATDLVQSDDTQTAAQYKAAQKGESSDEAPVEADAEAKSGSKSSKA